MSAVAEDIYADGVLDPEVHDRLVADLRRVCERAGIAGRERLVGRPLAEVCTGFEVRWARKFHEHAEHGRFGLVYAGRLEPPVEQRFPAMVACLLRNFVDARLVSVGDLVGDEDADVCTALFVPNLFRGRADGGYLNAAVV